MNLSKKLGVLLFAGALALTVPLASLSAGDDAPTLIQRSYDLEAAAKYTESLAALDQLPAGYSASFVMQPGPPHLNSENPSENLERVVGPPAGNLASLRDAPRSVCGCPLQE